MCPTSPTKNDTGGGEAQSAVLAAPLAPPEAARVRAYLTVHVQREGGARMPEAFGHDLYVLTGT